jgi:hypothetical protein
MGYQYLFLPHYQQIEYKTKALYHIQKKYEVESLKFL